MEARITLEDTSGNEVGILFNFYGGTGRDCSPDVVELDIEEPIMIASHEYVEDEGWRHIETADVPLLIERLGIEATAKKPDGLIYALVNSIKFGDAMHGAMEEARQAEEEADAEAEMEWRYSR